jgi:hypothetical protein
MAARLRDWVRRLLCRWWGHWAYIDYGAKGGGDPEVCRCCGAVLSTAWSRGSGEW